HVFSQENGGPSLARNNGLCKAQGKYVLYVDSDDYIEKDTFSKIVAACKEQDEPEIFFLNGYKVYDSGKKVVIEQDYDINSLHNKSRQEVFEYMANRNKFNASPCLKMIKKSFLENNHILFEVGKRDEDIDWSMECYLHAKTYGCYNGMYYNYRQGISDSNSATFQDNSYYDWKDILDKWVRLSALEEYKDISTSLIKMACYEYIILLVNCQNYIKNDIAWHRKMKKVLKSKSDKKTLLVRWSSNILGIYNTSRLLNWCFRMR
ncbi:MAG: glycosyltransferase, partial [Pseudobutyrivibrio sp.]|nr:glycosyltransferase [Pseudobutyrivibrio sp.]